MKWLIRIVAFTLTAALLSTCSDREEDCPDEPQAACPPCEDGDCFEEMKDYFYFKTGSYWVYREVNTGAIDSTWVYEDWEGAFDSGNRYFESRIHDTRLEYRIGYGMVPFNYYWRAQEGYSADCRLNDHCRCERIRRVKSRPLDYIGWEYFAFYPPTVGDYVGARCDNDATFCTHLFDSLEVGSVSYEEVLIYETSAGLTENCNRVITSYAKNIGVIRREYPDLGLDWWLQESEVIQ